MLTTPTHLFKVVQRKPGGAVAAEAHDGTTDIYFVLAGGGRGMQRRAFFLMRRLPHVHEEDRQPVGALLHLCDGRGAGDEAARADLVHVTGMFSWINLVVAAAARQIR
jgi:hypothetical protein